MASRTHLVQSVWQLSAFLRPNSRIAQAAGALRIPMQQGRHLQCPSTVTAAGKHISLCDLDHDPALCIGCAYTPAWLLLHRVQQQLQQQQPGDGMLLSRQLQQVAFRAHRSCSSSSLSHLKERCIAAAGSSHSQQHFSNSFTPAGLLQQAPRNGLLGLLGSHGGAALTSSHGSSTQSFFHSDSPGTSGSSVKTAVHAAAAAAADPSQSQQQHAQHSPKHHKQHATGHHGSAAAAHGMSSYELAAEKMTDREILGTLAHHLWPRGEQIRYTPVALLTQPSSSCPPPVWWSSCAACASSLTHPVKRPCQAGCCNRTLPTWQQCKAW